MEFLRFGSSIPGTYWGCCAVDIIQNFNVDPDGKSSIQLVNGDSGAPISSPDGKILYAGPTYKDIFLQRLRYGTFGKRDMPNHGFIAILTKGQVSYGNGAKWLKILKEQGFEFIRTVDNSVYSGAQAVTEPGTFADISSHENFIFGLFRNVGKGAVRDPFTPPKEWTDLPSVVPEAWQYISDSGDEQARLNGTAELVLGQQTSQLESYNSLPEGKFFSEEELEKDGVPVVYAGLRSTSPQETKTAREERKQQASKVSDPAKPAPFSVAPVVQVVELEPEVEYDEDEDEYDEDEIY